ncbi:hypothetical protein ACHAQA_001707 [Verticillium albo-atrum]
MAAKSRRNSVIIAAFCYLIVIIFLILVLIGNTSNKPVLRDTFFFRLDVSQVIPVSVPNANLLNSIARTLGLHDFYQIGLWNFCQGYNDEGITDCSKPKALWWFNPIEILTNQLLAGASIALPKDVTTILTVLRLAQQIMFGFFLSGICLAFVLILATPIAMRSRWWSLPIAIFAFLDAVLVTVASILGTAMSVVAKYALTAQSELNLRADLGIRMFVFMWIASVMTIIAFFVHAIMGCCCRIDRVDRVAGSTAATEKRPSGSSGGRGPVLPSFIRRRGQRSSTPVASPSG